jgi:adenosylcobinamide-phosphate synthase
MWRPSASSSGALSELVSPALHAIVVVVLAVALDLVVGDPPNRWHPVAWIGRVLAAGRRALCRGGPVALVLGGAALTLGVMALAAGAGALVATLAAMLGPVGLALEAATLKSTLSLRGLAAAARSVAASLGRGELVEARARLGVHLVSRPTAGLDAAQVASGAIESVAENLTDALVAPVMFFMVLGLPGALAYRALNTADTMLGYREGALEYFGKIAARLDDLANLVPARLAGLALVVVAGRSVPAAWSAMVRDHARTASPNAGWTMSAMAGALGVTLDKPGAYRLGQGRPPETADIERAVGLLARAAAVVIVAIIGVSMLVQKSVAR